MVPRKTLGPLMINERAQHFLKVLVERYIREGQPVGSRTLAKDSGLELSPATIRNVMSDLEEMGLVVSPHTSSGRVPTVTGYRLFVDSLLTVKPLLDDEIEQIRQRLKTHQDAAETLVAVTNLLSSITHMAGLVTLPKHERMLFHQIEFLRLSGRRILAILVTNDGEVHNRVLFTERDLSDTELARAAEYLTEAFRGHDIKEVRDRLIKEMKEARENMDRLMQQALDMTGLVIDSSQFQEDLLISGQTNLMGFDELGNLERLRKLFDAFTDRHQILQLLDKCLKADGIQIFIGEESGYELFDDCSLVTSPYKIDDQIVGVLGVIGPTRMAYDRVIPLVDITAKLLGAALKPR